MRFGPGRQNAGSDAAVDLWPGLVLVEVYSGRSSLDARSGEPELLLKAVRRATVAKINEVLDRAADVLPHPNPEQRGVVVPPRLVYPGAVAPPQKVWPIVVLAGDTISPTSMLWSWLRDELGDRLGADPRIATRWSSILTISSHT